MTYSEKLVRDKIPSLIQAGGREPHIRFAALNEYPALLAEKLIEEALEFKADGTLEELADVTEVLLALLQCHGWSWADLEVLRKQKYSTHGGFKCGTVLEGTNLK